MSSKNVVILCFFSLFLSPSFESVFAEFCEFCVSVCGGLSVETCGALLFRKFGAALLNFLEFSPLGTSFHWSRWLLLICAGGGSSPFGCCDVTACFRQLRSQIMLECLILTGGEPITTERWEGLAEFWVIFSLSHVNFSGGFVQERGCQVYTCHT